MSDDYRLAPGTLVVGEVTSRHPWGMQVELLTPVAGLVGSVDAVLYADIRPINSVHDLPAPGTHIEAVVLPYPPSGSLRLSVRESDLEGARLGVLAARLSGDIPDELLEEFRRHLRADELKIGIEALCDALYDSRVPLRAEDVAEIQAVGHNLGVTRRSFQSIGELILE